MSRTPILRTLVIAGFACLLLGMDPIGCGPPNHFTATVQRTSFGIPHIHARDFGGLGYGYGYAFAQDNICVLARDLVEANGQQARFFGGSTRNIERDFFYTYWSSDAVVDRFLSGVNPDVRELAKGYAAGYNRHLREVGLDGLADDCRGEPWVRPIDERDLFRLYYRLIDRAGASNLIGFLVAATPPPAPSAKAAPAAPAPPPWVSMTPEQFAAQVDLPRWKPEDIGSNMVALGGDSTVDGRGMLLVNPHFPWQGGLRFYQVHLTLPGKIDSMGASLFGSALPNIAFNRHVAWSHTVSTAERFVVRQLEIAPGDPTSYLVDGVVRAMTPTTVEIEVLESDGSITTREHTFWDSEYGPILDIVGWTSTYALAVEDVSRDNFRIFDQYLRMNQAANLDQLVAAVEEEAALPWVNTAAVDRYGNAWYGDVGTVPHVTAAKLASCQTLLSGLVSTFGITLLDGARSECALGTDPDSAQPGILGASNLPSLRTRSWVQNSNDSYWLANPASLLEGFSPLIGRERVPQGFRTRLGIRQIDERLAGTDGLPGNRFDLAAVQNLLTGNRNLSAELALDGVLTLCDEEPNDVDLAGEIIDVSGACAVLRAWDRRNDTTSVGTHVWRRVWDRLNDLSDPWVVPFDPDDAANTPAELDLLDPEVRSVGLEALATAVKAWGDDGIALDAPWGDVHFDVKNGVEIPIPGGPGGHGVYNAIGTRFAAGSGYTPVTSGSSIVMAISFDRAKPVAKGMLTYSQSTDPASPFYSDQTSELFSKEAWNDLPYTYKEIVADRLSIEKISEARPQ